MSLGIKLKMTLTFSIVFILMGFILNFYGYRTIKKMLITDDNRYLLARANSLLAKTEVNPVIIPLPDKNNMIRVSYLTTKGRHILFQSPGIIHKIITPLIYGVSDTLNQRVAFIQDTTEDNPAEILLAVSNVPLENNLQLLFRLLFVTSIISVIAAAIVSYFLAGLLLLPVQRIISAAKKITTNKLRDRITVNQTGDELQELTETINEMLQRIDEGLQQQQNFFASASHELKTPLTILKTGLEVHLNSKHLSSETKSLLHGQLQEITRLQEIVQEFLVISQLKDGSMTLHLQKIDLSEILLKAFFRLQYMINQQGLTPKIEFDKNSGDFFINADAEKIKMVLSNLIENSCKYAVKGSEIICEVSKIDTYLTVIIKNNTIKDNIPTEKLLTAFQRGDVMEQGAGVGLWLCNEIINAHKGSLSVKSFSHTFTSIINLPVVN